MSAGTGLAQLPTRERIIRTLFSEKDENGTAIESYITHVKIFEDAQYPSHPPPDLTATENLKGRYILLSVKKNGRVRMHKSRGNDNGTFQIGKTWNLDDLQKVQDTDRRGLIITMMKPYYWTMESAKDKYMFVSALTKVYKKYTGGRMFELLDFDPQHMPNSERASEASPQQSRVETTANQPRLPPTAPLRSSRNNSEIQLNGSREAPRQVSMPNTAGIGQLDRLMDRGAPGSRTASSLYGPPETSTIRHASYASSPMGMVPRLSSTSGEGDRAQNLLQNGNSPHSLTSGPQVSNSNRSSSISAVDNRGLGLSVDTQSSTRQYTHLGSPFSTRDITQRQPSSPHGERLPEKSSLRQTVDTSSELAPPLRSMDAPLSPMSPPPPAKSPARRPSAVRSTSNTSGSVSGRVYSERMAGAASPGPFSPGPSIPPMPDLPTKSGARVAESPRPDARPDLPWQSPAPGPATTDYFSTNSSAGSDRPRTVIATDPATLQSSTSGRQLLSPAESVVQTPQTALSVTDVEFDDDSAYMDEAIKDFRWSSKDGANNLAVRLQAELAALDSANIHAIVENDDRVEDLMKKLDRSIAQCDDMANLLTLYEFELGGVSDHIKHIESQSQGLQVQTANQLALVAEISNVLTNITISESDLEVLKGRGGNLESADGINNIEQSLKNLYRALKSMQNQKEEGGMTALKSKSGEYLQESDAFLSRLNEYLQIKFQAALLPKRQLDTTTLNDPPRVIPGHEEGFLVLSQYSALMLYARELNPERHADYVRRYTAASKSSWHDIILNFAAQWRALARKATSEENDMIFTSARDHQASGNARSATLKRSNTLAKQIRSVTNTKAEKDQQDAKLPASDVFRIILDNLTLLFSTEQNFLTSFFHVSSFARLEFPDYVDSAAKSRLTMESLDEHLQTEPDRALAKEKYIIMQSIFGWLSKDLSSLIEHFVQLDPIQAIGMIKSIEVVTLEWIASDQEFLLKTFTKMRDRLMGNLNDFIEAQIKAIRDSKVTSKKRKGIIPVFEIFPDFVERIEVQLQSTDSGTVNPAQLEIRQTVNEAYERLSKTMFESVRTLASSGSITSQTIIDPEDKEVLNYHILMIQNMHQYLQALQSRRNPILDDFKSRAQQHYLSHLNSYTRQIVLRPIGRLLDFTESVEKQLRLNEDPMTKSVYSSTSLKRLLNDFDERDMKKGISAMWKRVDKHFSDEENSSLQPVVWKAVQIDYMSVIDRLLTITSKRYQDVRIDFTKPALLAAFAKKESSG